MYLARKNWPHFEYSIETLQALLHKYASETSYMAGILDHMPEVLQNETLVNLMVHESVKTFEIEGEKLETDDVRSSLRHQLGLVNKPKRIRDPRAEGVAQLMLTIRKNYAKPLTKEELFSWHALILVPSIQLEREEIGAWRTHPEPMRIISGTSGKEKIHYEAPPSSKIPNEMNQFVEWFNSSQHLPGPIRAAIVHLYFECIHPFEDGNGRIGRALCEKALFQELDRPLLLSLSSAIEKRRKLYYEELSHASTSGLTITRWIEYFIRTLIEALKESKNEIRFEVQKAQFWKKYDPVMNERQRKVIKKMIEASTDEASTLSAQKYMKIADCSKSTATSDLQRLLQLNCLEKLSLGGSGTTYQLLMKKTPHQLI